MLCYVMLFIEKIYKRIAYQFYTSCKMSAIEEPIIRFNHLYSQITQSPSQHVKYEIGDMTYKLGLEIVFRNKDIHIQDDVLSKLIFIFPEDKNLLYHMGLVHKNTSNSRAIMWFKLCYDKSPTDYNNLVELSRLLVMSGMIGSFLELDKNGLFEQMIYQQKNNYSFIEIYINANQPRLYYKNIIACFIKMINHTCKTPAKTYEEKRAKWWAYHHVGFAYIVTGEIEKGIEHTTKAVDLANKFDLGIHAKLLSFQNLLAFHDFEYNDHKENFTEYLKINDYLPNVTDMFPIRGINNQRKINVGYVSSDFVNHPVSNFILPILKNHNREQFNTHIFSNTKEIAPEITRCSDNCFSIENMDAKTAATFIYSKNIDILIDLNGHTVQNRLDVFALNPAPIQMTYLGYPNTTGLTAIKYRITDAVADPVESVQPYSEKLLRLPTCFLIFQSFRYKEYIPAVVPRISNNNNSSNMVILGALNKEKKNSVEVMESWRTILRECPNTILIIKLEIFDNTEERMEFYMKHLDVDRSRLQIWNKLQNDEYDKMFSKIDILLDTYPYSGTTTTCEALWHSTPVITMKHTDYHCHNVSASILTHCGLSELTTCSPSEYINTIKNLINNSELLNQYKRTIHTKFVDGMNVENFMRGYEDTLMRVYMDDADDVVILKK